MRSLLMATKLKIQRFLNLNSGSITGATNATPIVITTGANRDGLVNGAVVPGHGLTTGDRVTIRSVGGNTAANGKFKITVLSSTTFSLQTYSGANVAGNGAYTSGGSWFVTTRDSIVDITDEGQPKPSAGQVFYGIVGRSVSNGNAAGTCLDEEYQAEVTLTLRHGYVPVDQHDNAVAASGAMWPLAESLRACLHMNYDLMNDANTNSSHLDDAGNSVPYGCNPSSTENGFVQPLRFSGMEYLGAKGPDWFWAEGQDQAITGVAVKLRFDFARRIQVIEEQS